MRACTTALPRFVEAAMMACRVTKRSRVICAPTVHPEWRSTLETYAEAGTFEVSRLPRGHGRRRMLVHTDGDSQVTDSTVSWSRRRRGRARAEPQLLRRSSKTLRRSPSITHEAGALLVVAVNPDNPRRHRDARRARCGHRRGGGPAAGQCRCRMADPVSASSPADRSTSARCQGAWSAARSTLTAIWRSY